MEEDDVLYDLAQALSAVGGQRHPRRLFDYHAAERAREYIHDAFDKTITLDELAQVSGRDRWSLTRDFRALFGTTPYRYVTMRVSNTVGGSCWPVTASSTLLLGQASQTKAI